jgi:hypothetical protein
VTIPKPDVAATDCGATTFFAFLAEDGEWRFCGTSAAAPHAAGVAALQLDAKPTATVAEIRSAQASTARPVGSFGPEVVGAGLLDAGGAIAGLPPAGASTVSVLAPDTAAPQLTILSRPPPKSTNRRPAFGFAASEPATFACRIDAGVSQPCASPFVSPLALGDGDHVFEVVATDAAGNRSRATVEFAIDTHAPQTLVRARPPAVLRTEAARIRATVRLGSDESGVSFVCKVDRGPSRLCGYRVSRRFGPGKHRIRVRARDEVGNVDPTPSVVRFRVVQLGAAG